MTDIDDRIIERLDRTIETLEAVGIRLEISTNRINALNVPAFASDGLGFEELEKRSSQLFRSLARQIEQIAEYLQESQQQSAYISELAKLVATQASAVDFLIRRTNA